jgi:hypothetical protein
MILNEFPRLVVASFLLDEPKMWAGAGQELIFENEPKQKSIEWWKMST